MAYGFQFPYARQTPSADCGESGPFRPDQRTGRVRIFCNRFLLLALDSANTCRAVANGTVGRQPIPVDRPVACRHAEDIERGLAKWLRTLRTRRDSRRSFLGFGS